VPELEEPLTVDIAAQGDEVVLVLVGELDPHTAPILRSCVDDTVSDDTTSLVLDVAGLQFIDEANKKKSNPKRSKKNTNTSNKEKREEKEQ